MSVCVKSVEAGQDVATTHHCPSVGPTKIGGSMTKTLVVQVWDLLDADMTKLMEGEGDKAILKASCRAYAEVLAIFMVPFFHTADEIAREASRRYKAKKADEEYETPGLGSLKYMPPLGSPERTVPKAAPAQSKSMFDAKTLAAIKFASESGIFKVEEIAKMYHVTVADIEKALA